MCVCVHVCVHVYMYAYIPVLHIHRKYHDMSRFIHVWQSIISSLRYVSFQTYTSVFLRLYISLFIYIRQFSYIYVSFHICASLFINIPLFLIGRVSSMYDRASLALFEISFCICIPLFPYIYFSFHICASVLLIYTSLFNRLRIIHV